MRVKNAMIVFSYEVSSAFKFLSNGNPNDPRLTTAKFIEIIAK